MRGLKKTCQLVGSHCSKGVVKVLRMEDMREDTEQVLVNMDSGSMTPTEKVEVMGPLRNTMAADHC